MPSHKPETLDPATLPDLIEGEVARRLAIKAIQNAAPVFHPYIADMAPVVVKLGADRVRELIGRVEAGDDGAAITMLYDAMDLAETVREMDRLQARLQKYTDMRTAVRQANWQLGVAALLKLLDVLV